MVNGQPTSDGEICCATEEEVYAVLDLPYIAPRLRENQGEIEAAQRDDLPKLVMRSDIVGDLHMHSTWSDGKLSILEMAREAAKRGHRYVAITDHSVSLGIANGLSVERLLAQADDVREANRELGDKLVILHGTEMEIKADGSLDYPDDVLSELDFVIASLHVSLSQPREQVTDRALSAIFNPHVDMLAHPTGRLLPERPGADLDMERVIDAAVETGTILEINANPLRLDLRDTHVRRAVELGARIAINTDAHRASELDLLQFGVAVAERGWLTARDVVNTWPLDRLRSYLDRRTRDNLPI
jgi:DNA polymerase (family 10)